MKKILIILCCLALAGCACFEDKQVIIKPKPIDNRDKWKALAPLIKKHFKTDMTVKEIAAELNYQEYLKNFTPVDFSDIEKYLILKRERK